MAKYPIVPDEVAAADVSAFAFAFTDGSADVAAAHPVAPIAVRAMPPNSEVPLADHAI
jgi:hypothetical protein